jgi:hypothetical protein
MMATRLNLTAGALGLTAVFAACAQGEVSTTGAGTVSSSSSNATTATSSSSSGSGTGGMPASTSSSTSTSSSSSSGSGGSGGGSAGTGGMNLCGNGVLDPGEECDGTNFGTNTCQSLGLGPGMLQCNQFCHVIVSGCTPLENCTNGIDDNMDGLVDCRDPECFGKPGCVDSCVPPYSASIGTPTSGDTTGRPAVHHASCSSAMSGYEQIFQVTAPMTGKITVDFSNFAFTDPEPNFSVSVRTSCETDSSEIACDNMPDPADNGDIIFIVPVTMGETFFVMVQGMTMADFGPFGLDLEMVTPEVICDDLLDNDFNGYTDCDDSNCQTLSDCVPGTIVTGQPCFQNTDCTANHNDPICLNTMQWPNGYCSEFCNLVTQDCSAGNICYAGLMISTDGVCLHECTLDSDCANGYACVSAGLSSMVCMLGPETACNDYIDNDFDGLTDCQDPTDCQTLPACVPGSVGIGQPCTLHSNCTASAGVNNPFCFDEADEFYPNGYCSHFCDPTLPSDCGPNAICVDLGPNNANVCMQTCSSDAQCRTADTYTCQDLGFAKMICSP